ncbi:putative reverse transcriptase domain-containing protein [Tanacetum coccineum]
MSDGETTRTIARTYGCGRFRQRMHAPTDCDQVRERTALSCCSFVINPLHHYSYLLERFNLSRNPVRIREAVAHVEAENWISHKENIFDGWIAYKQAKGGDAWVLTLTWAAFKELFFLQFFPRAEQERLKREYHSIPKGDLRMFLTVADAARSTRILRDRDDYDRSERQTRDIIVGDPISVGHFSRILTGVMIRKTDRNRHLTGRAMDWYYRILVMDATKGTEVSNPTDLPTLVPSSPGYPLRVILTLLATHVDEDTSRECRSCCWYLFQMCRQVIFKRDWQEELGASSSLVILSRQEADHRVRVFALTQDQAANTSGTITGALFIFGRAVFVLFDTGATHSVISTKFASCFTMTPILLDHIRLVDALPPGHCELDITLEYRTADCFRISGRISGQNNFHGITPILREFEVQLQELWSEFLFARSGIAYGCTSSDCQEEGRSKEDTRSISALFYRFYTEKICQIREDLSYTEELSLSRPSGQRHENNTSLLSRFFGKNHQKREAKTGDRESIELVILISLSSSELWTNIGKLGNA